MQAKNLTLVVTTALITLAIQTESSSFSVPGRVLSARPDPDGAKIKDCFLVNLETLVPIRLDGSDDYDYTDSSEGWSVKCLAEEGGKLVYVKFFYDDDNSTQYYSPERFTTPSDQPFWMNGDQRGNQVNQVDYLNGGGMKKFDVKFYTWVGGDEFPVDEKSYILNGSDKCDDVSCPVNAMCDGATGTCVCSPNFVLKDDACDRLSKCNDVVCPANAMCDEATGFCLCLPDFIQKLNGVCERPSKCYVVCPASAMCDEATGSCVCSPDYVLKNGVCEKRSKCDGLTCPAGSSCDAITGSCVCEKPNNVLINNVCKCALEKSTIYGFPNGASFDHSNEINECPQVFEASFRSGWYVDRVGLQLTNGQWLDDGGNGGSHKGLLLTNGEYVEGVKVCKDPKAIFYMKYTTSTKRVIEGGTNNNDCQEFKAPAGKAIVGFHGTSAIHIHSIGVIYGPAPSPIPLGRVESCARRGDLQIYGNFKSNFKIQVSFDVKSKQWYQLRGSCATSNKVKIYSNELYEFFHTNNKAKFYLRLVNPSTGEIYPPTFCTENTPIALDIDGSGAVERIQGEFGIDINGDGFLELLHEWFAPSEGILIDTTHISLDDDGTGPQNVITGRDLGSRATVVTGEHLFGDMGGLFDDGFDKLRRRDNDNNGTIEGAELKGLAIWIDANSDAKLDVGELSTLESHGIVGLSTTHDDNYVSTASLENGSVMVMEDLFFVR